MSFRHLLAGIVVLAAGCTSGTTSSTSPSTTTTPLTASTTTTTSPLAGVTTTAGPDATTTTAQAIPAADLTIVAYPVPSGSRPHDVAPAVDGGVWYTAQGSGDLGWLDPETGSTIHIDLGSGSRPHGVIVDADGVAWITDGGRNSIQSFDPDSQTLNEYPLPSDRGNANLNTAAFDGDGKLWFTGQNGIIGVLDPDTGDMEVFDAPGGRGPYGITATPTGTIYFASLAGSYVGTINPDRSITVLNPPTADQGARRVWSDSDGDIWVSEWNAGQLSRYQPDTGTWSEWSLPGSNPSAYAVYVDESDIVWVTDFGGNAIHRFDQATEEFSTFDLPSTPSNVRQLLGRPGEVWGAESAADQLVVIRRETVS